MGRKKILGGLPTKTITFLVSSGELPRLKKRSIDSAPSLSQHIRKIVIEDLRRWEDEEQKRALKEWLDGKSKGMSGVERSVWDRLSDEEKFKETRDMGL